MIRFYSPIFLLQAFCLYHVHKTQKDKSWYYLILFLPLIGSLYYLYDHYFTQRTIDQIADATQSFFTPDATIHALQNEVSFCDTIANRVLLAEAYMEREQYGAAIEHLEHCRRQSFEDDLQINAKLLIAYYYADRAQDAVDLGAQLTGDPDFIKDESYVYYGWSLATIGLESEADAVFQKINQSYTHYAQRMSYLNFLITYQKNDQAQALYTTLQAEIDQMSRMERRVHRDAIYQLKDLSRSM